MNLTTHVKKTRNKFKKKHVLAIHYTIFRTFEAGIRLWASTLIKV